MDSAFHSVNFLLQAVLPGDVGHELPFLLPGKVGHPPKVIQNDLLKVILSDLMGCAIILSPFTVGVAFEMIQFLYPHLRPYMRFLFVRPEFCRRLSSDSASRQTPLT